MNFLAHFSTHGGDDREGIFSMIVDALTVEEAVDKFEKEIFKIKKKNGYGGMFGGTDKIYLDNIIQISTFPSVPKVLRFEEGTVGKPGKVCFEPPSGKNISVFFWSASEEEPEDGPVLPFVTFEK